jgi:hypothetical protein
LAFGAVSESRPYVLGVGFTVVPGATTEAKLVYDPATR